MKKTVLYAALVLLGLSAAQADPAKRIGVDLKGHSERVTIERADDQSLTPVSMTKIGTDLFLIANYRNVYVFDAGSREAYPVKLDQAVPIWNPTAVYYSAFYDRLFIANYTGKDVIVAKIDRSGPRLKLLLDERLTENIVGPEGIAISNGGQYMAVADYDGAQVSLFERIADRWLLRWKKPLVAAHGVAIAGGFVFAGGVALAKFDVVSGKELARVTALAGEPIQFATCVDYDEQTSDLIASDAMSGRVVTLTRDLVVKEVFGANGPTFANLSMPYCVYRDLQATYILSTYQERIIRLDKNGTTSFEFGSGRWDYDQNILMQPPIDAAGSDTPSFALFNTMVKPVYGGIIASDGTRIMLPTREGILSNGWLFYVTSAAQNGDWLLVTSNSTPAVLLLNKRTNQIGFSPLNEQDCWALARDIVCPSRRYKLDDLLSKATLIDPGSIPNKATHEEAVAYLKGTAGKYVPLVEYWSAGVRSTQQD